MGLRCLLGHDFGDPETERERDEKGEEMVVTFRTVKTCARCGETQVVSENKEVTSIPEIAGTDDAAPDTGATDPVAGTDDAVTTDAVTAADDDGELVDATEPDDAAPDTAEDPAGVEEPSHPRVGEDEEFEPPQSAEEDDGIILDDEDDEEPQARKPGEWPDASDVGRGDDDRMPTLEEVEGEGTDADDDTETHEPTPWPDQQGEDEGFAAELDDGETADVDFGNRLAPEVEGTEEGYDAEFIGNAADAADTTSGQSSSGGFTRAETLTREEASDLATEYYCPECQMTRPANHSSMRAGDICPECHHGYVTERER